MYHLKTDYTDLGVFDFIGKAESIQESLSNPLFVGVNPPIAQLSTLIQDANAAATANPVNIIVRNEALDALDTCLGLIGAWVENFCNNDIVKLQASGFEIVQRNPIGPMPQPEALKVTTSGMPGSGKASLKWKAIYGCRLFQVQRTQYPVTPESVWQECATATRSRCEVDGLQPGTWAFRVIAISNLGKSEPSQPVSVVVG